MHSITHTDTHLGAVRPHDGTTRRRDMVSPTVADPGAPGVDLLLTGTPLSRAVVAALLLTMTVAPFLKGLLAGFALAGAAAAVRGVLGV